MQVNNSALKDGVRVTKNLRDKFDDFDDRFDMGTNDFEFYYEKNVRP